MQFDDEETSHLAVHFNQGVLTFSMKQEAFPIKGCYMGTLLHGTRIRLLETLT